MDTNQSHPHQRTDGHEVMKYGNDLTDDLIANPVPVEPEKKTDVKQQQRPTKLKN